MSLVDRISATLDSCTLSGGSAGGYGGAMDMDVYSSAFLNSCTLTGNSAAKVHICPGKCILEVNVRQDGGAARVIKSHIQLTACVLSSNVAPKVSKICGRNALGCGVCCIARVCVNVCDML